ncbi:MAG: helix-turn-helix domain-containing protein [Desulfosarcinaceae bacterium]
MPGISFVLYEHCLSSTITALIDAFSICNSLCEDSGRNNGQTSSSLFDMKIAAVAKKPVLTNGGVWIQPDATFGEIKKSDLIIIPPRLFARPPNDVELAHILPWLKINLKPERILTEDDGLICSGAITAMYNLALYAIEIFGSAELSRKCARILLVDHNRKSQQPYMAANFHRNHGDRQILAGQRWFEKNFARQFSIDDVANFVGLSPRHFKRRFKQATGENPLRYLQQIRLEKAKSMLETGPENIETITNEVGYEDSRTFRRLFKKYTSLSPREYRDRFGAVHENN